MTYMNIKDLCSNFQTPRSLEEDVLLWLSRASSKESRRIFLIPEWSIDDYWLWTSRMTGINIKEALCKISGPSVHWKRIFSLASPECPPRNLGGYSWFLNGVHMTLDVRNDIYINGSSVQNFRPLGALEADILLWVFRTSTKKSWRIFLIPEWRIDDCVVVKNDMYKH